MNLNENLGPGHEVPHTSRWSRVEAELKVS